MLKNFTLKIKNKKINIKVKICKSLFSQLLGLMFKNESPSLLFIFRKPKKISIHSFFCRKFIAIWLIDKNIIDIRIIKPNSLSVKPDKEFNKLLEIPENNIEFKKIQKFIDDKNI